MKILIAEDDEHMSKILKLYLQKEGHAVECVANGQDAMEYFETKRADLLLLDWMMPKKDGMTVCREIRQMKIPVKIIMLTAKADTKDELQGLTVGADDYIKKPFDITILFARINKVCKIGEILYFRDITMNVEAHEVMRGQKKLELTKTEFELLRYFIINQNRVLSREQILNHVWGMHYVGEARTVDTHVRRLRKKMGNYYINTSFGSGYIMEDVHE